MKSDFACGSDAICSKVQNRVATIFATTTLIGWGIQSGLLEWTAEKKRKQWNLFDRSKFLLLYSFFLAMVWYAYARILFLSMISELWWFLHAHWLFRRIFHKNNRWTCKSFESCTRIEWTCFVTIHFRFHHLILLMNGEQFGLFCESSVSLAHVRKSQIL